MIKLIKKNLSFVKSLYVNFILFPFLDAIKIPVIVSYNTKIGELHRGSVLFENISSKALSIGLWDGSFDGGSGKKNYFSIKKDGKLIIKEKAVFGSGCVINIESQGKINLGKSFSTNYDFMICCNDEISIGDNCLIGWNVTIMDGDGHILKKSNKQINTPSPIKIGNHVWLCSQVTVMKGASIPNNSVIAYGSLVNKNLDGEYTIFGGIPAKIIDKGIVWTK